MKHKQILIIVLMLVGLMTGLVAANQAIALSAASSQWGKIGANGTPATPAAFNINNGTIEAWFKTGAAGASYRGIVVKQLAWGLFLKDNVLMTYSWNAGAAFGDHLTPVAALNDNTWHHVAMSFQSGVTNGTIIYLDGIPVLTTTIFVQNHTMSLAIGYGNSTTQFFNGNIDEVRVWNTIRTPLEIAANMNAVLSPQAGLIGYWRMEGNLLDSSGNGYNGTLMGAPLPGFVAANDVTLPVELSSFTALPTAEYFVRLNWITQSETGVSGFRIYRGFTNELTAATNMNVFIEATNTATTQVYTYVDEELEGNGTYYYWLENVDLDGSSNYYGPVAATVNQTGGGDTPPIELRTGIEKIYPNPFNPQTNIRFSLKNDAPVEVVIYNLRGQKVRNLLSAQKTAGYHNLEWNGMDNSGMSCASGVYTVQVKIGNDVYTKQMVMSK